MERTTRFAIIVLGVLSICVLITACGGQGANTQNNTQPQPEDEVGGSESQPAGDEEPREPEEVPPPEPGETMPWVDGSLLVYIPPGEFAMGHEEGEGDNPRHPVYLDGFWIYRTEVTYAMYLNCMAKEECGPPGADPTITDIEDPALSDFPMVNIRWYQAAQYCEWRGGFLPTEAQWELAARGFEGFPFPWGEDEPNCERLNFSDCVGNMTPVFAYAGSASPFDVYDMAGNVFEWVADLYHEEYYYVSPYDNPVGPDRGEEHTIRGSAFGSAPDKVYSFLRNSARPDEYGPNLGFRCVIPRAHEYAPPCEVLASVPPDVGDHPDAPPSGEASCLVAQPKITYTYYCQNGKWRNNVSWTPADAVVTYNAYKGGWCITYDVDTVICEGPANAFVDMMACKSCPAPGVELGIMAKCDPPYVRDDASGLCRYNGPKVAKVECAPGFSLNADSSCCEMVDSTPWTHPLCPVGGNFDPATGICWYTLPSTGDKQCTKERIHFFTCKEDSSGGSGRGGTADPCAQYMTNGECRAHMGDGCVWDYSKGVCFKP